MVASNGRSGGNRSRGIDRFPADGGPIRPTGQGSKFDKKWDELLRQMPNGVLRAIDGHQLRALTTLLVLENELAATIAKDPANLRAARTYLSTVQSIGRLSVQYGLSPSDRQRLKIEPEQPDDLDEWQ